MSVFQPPFPWFGGKSRAAHLIWERLGAVPNYVEPFFGSGAVLLLRPDEPKVETVNDLDGYIANFWRAVKHDPEAVAAHADNPVNEADLHSRHSWLVSQGRERLARLMGDPEYYDARVAGWWVWGQCSWIGSGWCAGSGPWASVDGHLVNLGNPGRGVNRQLPHLGDPGRGERRRRWLLDYFAALSDRLRHVRVACGDWSRVVTPAVTTRLGLTGIVLDPPYDHDGRARDLYSAGDAPDVAAAVREWAMAHGDDPQLRIALCGYAGDFEMPDGWQRVSWTNRGGYGSQSERNVNRFREVIWFSPHCLRPEVQVDQPSLFAERSLT